MYNICIKTNCFQSSVFIYILGAIHILRQHFLGSLDTLDGVVSTWSAFALTLGTYTLMT